MTERSDKEGDPRDTTNEKNHEKPPKQTAKSPKRNTAKEKEKGRGDSSTGTPTHHQDNGPPPELRNALNDKYTLQSKEKKKLK